MTDIKNKSILTIRGIGEKRAGLLSKLGIDSVDALLRYYPRAYNDYTAPVLIGDLVPETVATIRAKIDGGVITEPLYRQPISRSNFYVKDKSGSLKVILYHKKQMPFYLKRDTEYIFSGKVQGSLFDLTMSSPTVVFDNEPKIQAIYPLKNGISQSIIKNSIKAAIKDGVGEDPIPQEIRRKYSLCELDYAIQNIHFPLSNAALEAAKKRLVFEELYILQTAMLSLKSRHNKKSGVSISNDFTDEFFSLLPFEPTSAQVRVTKECINDIMSGIPLNRLIQGDVGSGKTAVAAALCFCIVKNGYQAAIMAPTEILAQQHFNTFSAFFKNTGISCSLITGSLSAKQRRQVTEQLKDGSINVAIGTHALISDGVEFADLGLVITDEQHRFGVAQRAKLSAKGDTPHRMVMSATPIPRTLALIIYGDLDISVIDEYPKNRQVIDSYSVTSGLRERVYNFIKKNINEGRQAYIVCPAVEENENELVSAEEYFKELSTTSFKDYSVGLLHGKMKTTEKDRVMNEFKEGKINLLVCTTVIEVGIDVPNATVMVIENAERFGLSQLHQLRGRIGRGSFKSTCIFISDNKANKRLNVMCQTNDGFKIADEDLKMRGPGDFLGRRQHGLPELKIANFGNDMYLFSKAAEAARKTLLSDPLLEQDKHRELKEQITLLLTKSDN